MIYDLTNDNKYECIVWRCTMLPSACCLQIKRKKKKLDEEEDDGKRRSRKDHETCKRYATGGKCNCTRLLFCLFLVAIVVYWLIGFGLHLLPHSQPVLYVRRCITTITFILFAEILNISLSGGGFGMSYTKNKTK